MPLFTIKLSFLITDELMKRLVSLSNEVGEPRDKVISTMLQSRIDELSSLAVSILNRGIEGWEKFKQEKGDKK